MGVFNMSGPPKPATCPQCNSPSIQAVQVELEKPTGSLLADLLQDDSDDTANRTEKVIQVVCLSCGCKWTPGSPEEREMRALSGQLGEPAKQAATAQAAEGKKEKDRQAEGSLWLVILGGIAALVYFAFFYHRQ